MSSRTARCGCESARSRLLGSGRRGFPRNSGAFLDRGVFVRINAWAAGLVATIASFGLFSWIDGPSRCRDGWRSPSIGLQGACSHHGGVRSSPAGAFSILTGIGAGLAAAALLRRRGPPSVPAATPPISGPNPEPLSRATGINPGPQAPTPTPKPRTCEVCGGDVRFVLVSAGPPPHGSFWECLNNSCGARAPLPPHAPFIAKRGSGRSRRTGR